MHKYFMQLNFKNWLISEDDGGLGVAFTKFGQALAGDTANALAPMLDRQVSGPVAKAAGQASADAVNKALAGAQAKQVASAANAPPRPVTTAQTATSNQQQAAFNQQQTNPVAAKASTDNPQNMEAIAGAIKKALSGFFK